MAPQRCPCPTSRKLRTCDFISSKYYTKLSLLIADLKIGRLGSRVPHTLNPALWETGQEDCLHAYPSHSMFLADSDSGLVFLSYQKFKYKLSLAVPKRTLKNRDAFISLI